MIASLRRAFRDQPLLAWSFTLLAIATIVPIWIGRYLPLLDLPNHLSAIAVWHYYNDPRFDFSRYYRLNLSPLPYWAHYYFCHLAAYAVGVENANRLFLTLYALALPSGALLLARRFDRSPYLALFAFPLVWNFNLAEGFVAYSAGMAMLVLGLVVADRHYRRPTLGGALALVAVGTAAYFFHLLTYMLFLVCAGLLLFTQDEPLRPRRLVERGVPLLGGTVIGLWAYHHNATMGFASGLDRESKFVWDSLVVNMARVPERLLNFLSSSRDEWVAIALGAAWLLIALTAARQRDREPERRFSPRDLGIEVCLLATAAAALLGPRSMQRPFNWYMIDGRFAPLAALFAALLVRGPVLGWRRWLFVPVVAAGLFYAVDLSRMVVVFNRHVDGFDQLVSEIPLHKKTLTMTFPPLGDPEINVNCFNQWASYTQLRRGGYNFYNFNYGFPLKYRVRLPAPPWSHVEMFRWDFEGPAWDYFLTHNEGIKYDVFSEYQKEGKVRLVDARGAWKLWQRIEPVTTPAPAPEAR